jgi:hypothetical protein
LLFFIYLVSFCWLLTKIKFIRNAGINNQTIIILFLIRIIAGVINGYINLYHYAGTDAASFHQESIIEYHLLFNNPKEYFTNIFNYHNQNSGLLDITDSFWNNLRGNLMVKLLSIFNIFSRGNFFINTIFYNFIIFFGSISFYKIFIRLFPDKKILLVVGLFLLPSLLYFSSGIHKDGLIFLGLGICCYNLFYILKEHFSFKHLLYLLSGLMIVFLLRNFVLITLLPAVIAWIIAEKNKKFILQTYIIVYLAFIVLFFTLGKLHSSLDLPQYVSIRQIAFVQISKGSQSAININPLFSNFRSFLNNSPQALNHSLMRPYLTEKFTLLYIPPAIEIFIYELLFLIFLLFRITNKKTDSFIYFCIFFSLSIFLMIGYTIPIIGAIVRYRSIYFPMLIIPIICYIDWQKFRIFIRFKK